MNHVKLSDIAFFVEERIGSDTVSLEHYVTTDSLLQNKAGRELAQNLPPNRISLTKYKAGDVLVSNIRPYLKKIWQADCSGGCSSDVLVFRARPHHSPGFLYALLLQDAFFDYVMTGKKGSKMPRGDKQQIMLYPVLQFSGKDEERIGYLISAVSQKILINEKLNDNLEAMAQALYDYWFVQFDFPDENGKPYKSSGGKMVWSEELKREIPEGWRIDKLIDIIQANPTEKLGKGVDAPYIAMEALSTTNYLTGAPARKKYAGGMKFRNMDVLIARITPCLENGKTALVHDLNVNEVGFGSTEYIVIRGKHFPLPLFCITLARSPEFRPYAISKMTGTSGRRRLDYKDVETYRLPIPPDEVLRRFESWGNPVLEKMHQQHIQSRALEKQRDFLLPLLMNGQVQLRQ